MAQWQANPEVVQALVGLFADVYHGTPERQAYIYNELDRLQNLPDFSLYLAYILSSCPGMGVEVPAHIRAVSCFRLRKYVLSNYKQLTPDMLDFIRSRCFDFVNSDDNLVRNSVHDVLAVLGPLQQLNGWAPLLQQLFEMLSVEGQTRASAMSCLHKLCDELTNDDKSALLLSSPQLGNPLAVLIPRFIELALDTSKMVRKDALNTLLCFVYYMPAPLVQHMPQYLQALFTLAEKDTSPAVREVLCSTFSALVSTRFAALAPVINEVISFILHCSNRDDDVISTRACEFWDALLGDTQNTTAGELMKRQNAIRARLTDIVPVLLACTVYSEMDLLMMAHELEDDQHVEDRDQDIRPRFYDSKRKGDEDEDEEEEEEEEDDNNEWTTRKAAATALDHMSRVFQLELLQVAVPLLQQYLQSSEWTQREAAVLVLGAMSFGCLEQMSSLLPQVIPLLLQLLTDEKALLRSTASWALGCYSNFIAAQPAHLYMEPYLAKIVNCIVDKNKKVQYSACCSLATFATAVEDALAPYLIPLFTSLMAALPLYRAKNTPTLLDALQTVVAAAGPALQAPQLQEIVVVPFFRRFAVISNQDRAMADYLICLYHLVANLGEQFPPFAAGLYTRVLEIIRGCLDQLKLEVAADPDAPLDPETSNVLAAALDLTSAMAETLGGSFDALMGDSGLVPMLIECMELNHPAVQQPTLAVVGDLARTCSPERIGHFLVQCVSVAANCITPDPSLEDLCNNASWAIGEVALRLGNAVAPQASVVCTRLAALLVADTSEVSSALHITAATTLGRFAIATPEVVSAGVSSIFGPWCYWLSKIKNAREKEQAYRGLVQVVRTNVSVLAGYGLTPLAQAMASWKNAPHSVLQSFGEMLHWVKATVDQQWTPMWSAVPDNVRTQLSQMYGL